MRVKSGYSAFCCCLVLLLGLLGAHEAQGYIIYECGSSSWHRTCDNHGGYKCKEKNKVGAELTDCLAYGGAVWKQAPVICGDGVRDGAEECDDGSQNSDSTPNACRTKCVRAYCGDYVIDNGEDCDEGSQNSDLVPNQCRTNCRFPVCGDGVLDAEYGNGVRPDGSTYFLGYYEECDDGNQEDYDGCRSDCRTCTQLTGNIFAQANTFICRGNYSIASYGETGVIIVNTPGAVVDCSGAILNGTGEGAGIFISAADDVTIRNCSITGYAAAVKAVNSQRVVIEANNNFTGNTRGVVLENSTKVQNQIAPRPQAPSAALQGGVTGESSPAKSKTAPRALQGGATPTPGKVVAPQTASPALKPVRPLATAPAAKPQAVAKPVTGPAAPHGRLEQKGKHTLLYLNVEIARAEVFAGKRRLGQLPGGRRLDITPYIGKAQRGELTMHYYDKKGAMTSETISVGAGRK